MSLYLNNLKSLGYEYNNNLKLHLLLPKMNGNTIGDQVIKCEHFSLRMILDPLRGVNVDIIRYIRTSPPFDLN